MKKRLFGLVIVLATTLACLTSQPAATAFPPVSTLVAATVQALTAAAPLPATISAAAPPPSPQPGGNTIAFGNIRFTLPADVASNALAGTVPASAPADDPFWNTAPEHTKFALDGYGLRGTFHAPYILVYPAQEYAAVNEGAGMSIARLQAILNGSAAPTADNLPAVPSFNAGQLFAAQIQLIQFHNGMGVRFLTVYGQYYATANNHDLFYQFQGLTDDGKYYIIAILPASHPLLAFDSNPETAPPAGGIPFPGYDNENAVVKYYNEVVSLLNSADPESFYPALLQLDALMRSIQIAQ